MCSCWSSHHLYYFISGMFFCELLIAISLYFSGALPLTYFGLPVTHSYATYAIVSSGILFALFLFLGRMVSKCHHSPENKSHTSKF